LQVLFLAKDGRFVSVYNALDSHMREASHDPALANVTKQKRFTPQEKKAIRDSGLFQKLDSWSLMCRTYWVIGYECCLRGCEEHVNCKWSDFSLEKDEDGFERVVYTFPPDKTANGGIEKHLSHEPAMLYPNDESPSECPVRLYKELALLRPAGNYTSPRSPLFSLFVIFVYFHCLFQYSLLNFNAQIN
jgi:hypothetical protein